MARKSSNVSVPGNDASLQITSVLGDPTRRIRDCGQARELYTRLYLENQRRAAVYAQVRNQIEGGMPFNADDLRSNGEAWRTNVNFRDAEAAFFRAYLPYWKMVHEVPRKASFSIHEQSPDVAKWEVGMAEAFDRFIDDWGSDYYMQFQGATRDFVKFGPGYVMWPDGRTPRFKWAQTVQMYFPKRTKANVDDWELICLKREMNAAQLYEKIGSKEDQENSTKAGWNTRMVAGTLGSIMPKTDAQKRGWNKAATELAIQIAAPTPSANRYFDPNYYQDLVVNNDLVIGGVWPPVVVVDLWARKKGSSKVGHYIFTEKSDVPDFLYQADEEAEGFRQIFGTLFYDIGENGLLHSVKGFGVKNYYYATTINRTKCRLIDAVTFSAGMNFIRTDNAPDESPPVENYSMVNIFPQGLTQLQYFPQLQQMREVVDLLKANQDENNYTYNEVRPDIAETKTARQATILASIGQEMSTATSSTYLYQVGAIYAECFRRLRVKDSRDPDAKKFQERCKDLGIPDKVVADSEITVKTGASPTMASPLVRDQIATELLQTVYAQPEANRRWILEFYVGNKLGADGVQRALLPIGQDSDPRARREAMMENVDLSNGIPLPVDPSDSHVEHGDEHLKPLEAMAQAAQQGQQIGPDHLISFEFVIPHVAAHVQALSTDKVRAAQYQQLKARLTNVANIANGIKTRLARATQRGASPEAITQQLQQPPA
jgi:hypothetical protein